MQIYTLTSDQHLYMFKVLTSGKIYLSIYIDKLRHFLQLQIEAAQKLNTYYYTMFQ